MTPVPVTLLTAAAAVALNTWLGGRISGLRRDLKVSVGDGGHELLLRRMRAQANFIENAPFLLILVGGLELSGGNRLALGLLALIFVLARISHGIGMDAPDLRRWRMWGMIGTCIGTFSLAIWALACVGRFLLGG
jgi:uncharacterized membrane protein YecN with MAPEG domain